MFFDKLFIKSHKKIKDIFKNFSLLIHGGVNFQPYSNSLFNIIGKRIDTIETYPASEGFIAFQDSQKDKGLLLQLNNGIFFEFIKLSDYYSNNIKRLSVIDIEINVNYVSASSNFKNFNEYLNPNNVKVICDKNKFASEFYRDPLVKNKKYWNSKEQFHHIGIYGYTKKLLDDFCNLPISELEKNLKLEQLRALENDIPLMVLNFEGEIHRGVDTPEDLSVIRKYLKDE